MNKQSLIALILLTVAASIYAADDTTELAEQLMDADERQLALLLPKGIFLTEIEKRITQVLPILTAEIDRKPLSDVTDAAKEKLATRQANAAVVLLHLNQPSKVWPLLKHSPGPSLRSHLIRRLALGADAGLIINRLDDEQDITIRRALLLSLGEFEETELSPRDLATFLPKLQQMYRTEPDPGLHGASEWLLRRWNQEWMTQATEELVKNKEQRTKRLEGIQQTLVKDKEKAPPQWYVNGQGQTLVVIPGPVEFLMGSSSTVSERHNDEPQHKRQFDRSFAIASTEVTVAQFLRFRNDHKYFEQFAPTLDCPVNEVSWYDAAAYCNWLSQNAGIPKNEWCYLPNEAGEYAIRMKMAADYLQRTGYRLPTETEWEYACRAGASTRFSFGETNDVLPEYAWYSRSSDDRSHPVGLLKPNDLGLWDMHGNALEWTQDAYKMYPAGEVVVDDSKGDASVKHAEKRVLRGGSYHSQTSVVRSAHRYGDVPTYRHMTVGFRVARTLSPVPLTAVPTSPEGKPN